MKIIDKKEFIKTALNKNVKAFVVHITSTNLNLMPIHSAQEAQIALLIAKEVKISTEYSDFSDVFLEEKTSILLEKTKFNQYAIKLQEGQQLPYRSIYSLALVELKTLKTYIETNLANNFIWSSKSPAGAPILFVRKPDGSFCLSVDYRSFNNLTIKNQYSLPFSSKSLDQLGQAKKFTKLDLTSTYHQI